MDRMNDTDNAMAEFLAVNHVGWPQVFPDVPSFIIEALSTMAIAARSSAKNAQSGDGIHNKDIARGHAWAFTVCAEWLAEDLARCMWWGDGDTLVWIDHRYR